MTTAKRMQLTFSGYIHSFLSFPIFIEYSRKLPKCVPTLHGVLSSVSLREHYFSVLTSYLKYRSFTVAINVTLFFVEILQAELEKGHMGHTFGYRSQY